jgi:hypothetical protein
LESGINEGFSKTRKGKIKRNSFKIIIFKKIKNRMTMEKIAARKYAIIEKVMQLNEEELTELEASLLKVPETPVSSAPAKKTKKEARPEDDRDEVYNLKKIKTMGRKW